MNTATLTGIRFAPEIPIETLSQPEDVPPRLRLVRPDLAFDPLRSILMVSRRHANLCENLRRRGASVTLTADAGSALALLASHVFDVLAVDPEIEGGLDLVKWLKLSPSPDPAEQCLAKFVPPSLPVFVLPLPNDCEYAIIVQARTAAFLERETRIPLEEALIRFDLRRFRGPSTEL